MRDLNTSELEKVSGGDCWLFTATQGGEVIDQWITCDSDNHSIRQTPGGGGGAGITSGLPGFGGIGQAIPAQFMPDDVEPLFEPDTVESTPSDEARQEAVEQREHDEQCVALEAERLALEARIDQIDREFDQLGQFEPGRDAAEFAQKFGPTQDLFQNFTQSRELGC